MKELSLHILDIAENSIRAKAKTLKITLIEDTVKDSMRLIIEDDGCGMDEETMKKAVSPFYTSKTVRKVGMGLSMLKSAAERTGGGLTIESSIGIGTIVTAWFSRSHIDRQPLGDMGMTIINLMIADPQLQIEYRHQIDNEEFIFNSDVVKSALEGVPVTEPEVMHFLLEGIRARKSLMDAE